MNSYGSTSNLRRAVKDIAIKAEALEHHNSGARGFAKSIESLDRVEARLSKQDQRLAQLRRRALDDRPPAPTAMRNLRSGVLLAAGAATRVAAVATAAGVGVVEGTVVAVTAPVRGCLSGSFAGCGFGASFPVGVAKPLTATGCMGLGAAVGTTVGVVGVFAGPPSRLAKPSSFTQRVFRSIDQYPKAVAHAKRKKMSTEEIASETASRIKETKGDVRMAMFQPREGFGSTLLGTIFGGDGSGSIFANDEGGITSAW